MVTGLHWAANIPTRWLEDELKSRLLRQAVLPTPSSGEKTPSCPMTLTEWQDWVDQMQTDVLVLKQKVAALEPGPQSPAITAPSMTPTPEAPSDAEPCSICHLPQESGLHRHPMAPVLEPDSPPASTAPATSLLSPWGQPTTPIFLVEPGCGCAPAIPIVAWMHPPQHQAQVTGRCPTCDALWFRVVIRARDAPASPSGST